jgi:TfoX/Sxy family transcriptional regulator of competence genes
MAHDTQLESRIDRLIDSWGVPLTKMKMFGGVGYLAHGNMAFGIHKDGLVVRTTEEQGEELLRKPGVRVFDMTGRPMKNWFLTSREAIDTEESLLKLLELGRDRALTLPPK